MADETTTDDAAKPEPKKAKAKSSSASTVKAMKAEATGDESRSVALRDQSFRVVDELPGITLLDLGLAADPEASDFDRIRAVRRVLDDAIVLGDRSRFKSLLRNAQPTIGMQELDGVISQLIELVTGSPT
ncbi:MAG TPA: hypothetical protein VMW08_00110 [Acidimicrobiales bacterium]|nr:hypothetical protein [Acidimicrobiales bacterium]